jgi:hypothetical protein
MAQFCVPVRKLQSDDLNQNWNGKTKTDYPYIMAALALVRHFWLGIQACPSLIGRYFFVCSS